VCGGPLSVRHLPRAGSDQKPPYYRCLPRGCVSAPAEWLEGLVTAATIHICANPILYRSITRDDDQEASAARDEAAAERNRLADLEQQVIENKVSPATFARIAAGIETRIAELDARAVQLSAPPALRDLLGAPVPSKKARLKEIHERWLGMPVAARREVVKELFAPTLSRTVGEPDDPRRLALNFRLRGEVD
jgi:hypothetical protein